MKLNIAVLDGDGIGPEICRGAVTVLERVGEKFGHEFEFKHYPIGGCAIDDLGAVGGYKWDDLPGDMRPEKGLLRIRRAMGLYSNIRPAKLWKGLANASPLKHELVKDGIEIIIVRELTGGIYFGERGKGRDENGDYAWDTERYSVKEIERITRIACELAVKRSKKLVSVDKANVLESSRLWRKTVHEYCTKNYPQIEVKDVLVDNMAMQIVKDPAQFDVVVTSNMFGDILSDEAAQVTGSIGMLASSSLGDTKRGLYEPIHGSAPDIAGQDKANPVATILAAAMMLRDSFDLTAEYAAIEIAVQKTIDEGLRTADIMEEGKQLVGCSRMSELIAQKI